MKILNTLIHFIVLMTTKYRNYLVNIAKLVCKDAKNKEISELEKIGKELWNVKSVSWEESIKEVKRELMFEEVIKEIRKKVRKNEK